MSVINFLKYRAIYIFFVVALSGLSPLYALATPAATISKLNGVASVVRADGRVALLVYDGLALNAGDTVTTEHEASLLLVFADKSQVALSPGTKFQIKAFEYDDEQPLKDNMILSLLKGGIRSVTGFVSKRGNHNAYKLETATATIGIRGTDYTARLCETDCADEQKIKHKIEPPPSGAIGRVAELEGTLTDVQSNGKHMMLGKYHPFFATDELQMGDTGSATLLMMDGTRITLQSGSAMKMQQYRYEQAKPDNSNILLELLKGAARIATGKLGKARPKNVNFKVVTATIGIRGTAFDLVCGKKDKDPCEGELYVSMREGKTRINSGQNEMEISKGQTAHIASAGSAPELLPETPQFIKNNPLSTPESLPLDEDMLLGTGKQDIPAGLYASVNDGRIVMTQGGQEVEIGKGESGYAPGDGGSPSLMITTPAFLDYDSVLSSFPFIPGLCGVK